MSETTDDDGEADGPTCHACGDRITETDLQRVITKVDEGTVIYRRFCDDSCLETWRSAGELDAFYASG